MTDFVSRDLTDTLTDVPEQLPRGTVVYRRTTLNDLPSSFMTPGRVPVYSDPDGTPGDGRLLRFQIDGDVFGDNLARTTPWGFPLADEPGWLLEMGGLFVMDGKSEGRIVGTGALSFGYAPPIAPPSWDRIDGYIAQLREPELETEI